MLTRCLILACGNPLRGDDGLGPYLAAWAEDHLCEHPALRILARQQWTPDLAEEISRTDTVLFLDASVQSAPGEIQLVRVEPYEESYGLETHHLSASRLLGLCRELYDCRPREALLLTIGIGSTNLGEEFSTRVKEALPEASKLLKRTALRLLAETGKPE